MSTEQDFEEFAKKYPDLMAKSIQLDYIGVGRGWFHILDTLFDILSAEVEKAKDRLKHATENPNVEVNKDTIELLEAKVKDELDKLPCITEIKEKFGGLRFYIDSGTQDQYIAIEFAEGMSTRVCEVCGKPGRRRRLGWIKTLCEDHFVAHNRGEDIWREEEIECRGYQN